MQSITKLSSLTSWSNLRFLPIQVIYILTGSAIYTDLTFHRLNNLQTGQITEPAISRPRSALTQQSTAWAIKTSHKLQILQSTDCTLLQFAELMICRLYWFYTIYRYCNLQVLQSTDSSVYWYYSLRTVHYYSPQTQQSLDFTITRFYNLQVLQSESESAIYRLHHSQTQQSAVNELNGLQSAVVNIFKCCSLLLYIIL